MSSPAAPRDAAPREGAANSECGSARDAGEAANAEPEASPLDEDVATARRDGRVAGRAAFGRLFDAYHGRVLRFCVRRVGGAAAEDVASECWLAVAGEVRRFRGQTETDFRCWLYRVAATRANAHLRTTRRRGELLADAVADGRLGDKPTPAADPTDATEDWAALRSAIGRLSEREQTIVTLRSLEGLPHEEVAAAVGLRVGATRTAHSRALAKLRGWLTEADTTGGSERSAE
ncbi:MAG: RNA polymerase sigma factor [Planctomycetota bacterium]